ncbi:unnamed protein product [Heligmosomoides polygyrus]|uniref:TLDc domain-containing protein n=1 Tax=Heligmosomoides polygyrus TaxID=6339 RepID=A0A3P8EUP1_HELPZ|nr:unnamed protein product [Heligmosomoides polygyrus]
MFFAFYVGSDSPASQAQLAASTPQCSLNLNLNNTRDSINMLSNVDQTYSFILFTNSSRTIGPYKSADAISRLSSITSSSNIKAFSQSSVMNEFVKQSVGNHDDRLVYYIPCSYVYKQSDDDQTGFVKAMDKGNVQNQTLIVSYTNTVSNVSKWLSECGTTCSIDYKNNKDFFNYIFHCKDNSAYDYNHLGFVVNPRGSAFNFDICCPHHLFKDNRQTHYVHQGPINREVVFCCSNNHDSHSSNV